MNKPPEQLDHSKLRLSFLGMQLKNAFERLEKDKLRLELMSRWKLIERSVIKSDIRQNKRAIKYYQKEIGIQKIMEARRNPVLYK